MNQDAFAQVPRDAGGHFRLHFFAAVLRVLRQLNHLSRADGRTLDDVLAAYPFLAGYLAEIVQQLPDGIAWADTPHWWEQEIMAWEGDIPLHLPLRTLGSMESRLAFVLAGLVEEDSRFGDLFGQLQQPQGYRRPSLAWAGRLLGDGLDAGSNDAWRLYRPLIQGRFLEVADRDAPRAEWILRIPSLLWEAVRGELGPRPAPWAEYHAPGSFSEVPDLIYPPEFLARLAQVPALIESGRARGLVLRGMEGSERLDVVGAVARGLGRGVLAVEQAAPAVDDAAPGSLLGPLCTLAHCLPVLTFDLGPGDTVELPALPGYEGPAAVILGQEGGVKGALAEQAVTLVMPMPRADLRLRHWQRALDGQPAEGLEIAARRFHMPEGYIRQAGTMALAYAGLARRSVVALDDIRQACRTLNRQLLDSLAARLDAEGTWQRLVVSEGTASRLRELELRCRHREALLDHLGEGFGSTENRGVRALFTGASGTGKTLSARILAAELGMDLYRVDLGAVVNKYIGETEKNLHRVLSRAEELDVILLLDEGDALLGNRTEVKSANDRYANLETDYLLQRLENYQGIVVITTNAGQFIDNAFQRRMDVVVNFVPPQAAERRRIWALHLPADHVVDAGFLDSVVARCALTGGQIRNAALHASLLALGENGVVTSWHLAEAVESEYRKAGALYPLNGNGHQARGRVGAFLDVLRQ